MNVTVFNRELPGSVSEEIDIFVRGLSDFTVFQSPAFYNFYLSIPHYTPFYFIARNQPDRICGVLLAVIISEGNVFISFISSRCVVYGGPLVTDENGTLEVLLEALNKIAGRRALFTQFRNFKPWTDNQKDVFKKFGFLYRERLNLLVSTKSEQEVLSGMSSSRRRQIKKGIEAGVQFRSASSTEEVMQLYGLLAELYKLKVRKPLPDKNFFMTFYGQLVQQKQGAILLVFFDDALIGGAVCPVSVGSTLSELYICGLDEKYPQCYPSVMATWAALSYAADNALPEFDFMGLGKPEVKYGVRDFKLRFGGQVVNYGRFARRNYKILYAIAEIGYNILRSFKRV
ncbi:MAG: GNAT family N-acetyltransferase [Bacteroidales bacterium]|nr:GNAT family N-acetyltransferase [Bacteroidales bacterium]